MNNNEKLTLVGRFFQNRITWMILSLAAAIMLWAYVTSTEGVEAQKTLTNVPVEFIGADALRESSGLVVTEQDRTSVNLTVSAARRILNKINSGNVSATINLSRMNSDGRYAVSYDLSYPTGINPGDVTVVRSSADIVNFYLDKISRKTIEVEGAFTGNTAEGYMADESLVFEPMVVTISGPKTDIARVDHAYVAITRENVDKTLQYSTTYELVDEDGKPVDDSTITREREEINVTLNVLSTRTVPLDVTIVDGGGATREDNTIIDIRPASIVLAGDASTIDSTSKLVLGTIDLSTFATDYMATYTIVPPSNTENLTGVNEAVVTVSISGLNTRGFAVTQDNISLNNVPEGYTAEIITQSLNNVIVRAPEEVISEIDSRNLRAVADLSDLSITSGGVYNPSVRIFIDGFPEAGYVGEYKIYVTLTPEETEGIQE
ncbi:MAG: hypothetical protein IJH47_01095 [Oscillospiraceae bacterium]|nr:hypothetical protein [Oscillospiraceae bacterium]